MLDKVKEALSVLYYVIGAVGFILAFVRVLYGWFRDFDNAHSFTTDMATNHLPAIYKALERLAEAQGVSLDPTPLIRFAKPEPHQSRL